jgi:DNA repair protein RadA/Sms
VRADAVLIGEIGLSGELRSVSQLEARLREAANLGFKVAIVPKQVGRRLKAPSGLEIIPARSLKQALQAALA